MITEDLHVYTGFDLSFRPVVGKKIIITDEIWRPEKKSHFSTLTRRCFLKTSINEGREKRCADGRCQRSFPAQSWTQGLSVITFRRSGGLMSQQLHTIKRPGLAERGKAMITTWLLNGLLHTIRLFLEHMNKCSIPWIRARLRLRRFGLYNQSNDNVA